MMSGKRITEVAREQALLIDDRVPGYREDIVRCLMKVIGTQNEGHSDRGRKERVAREVEALGHKVAAQAKGDD